MNFVTVSTHALASRILENPYSVCGSLHHLAEAQRPKLASYITSKDLSLAAACLIRDTLHISIDEVPSDADDPARETLQVVAWRSGSFEGNLIPARRVFARFLSMQPDRLVAIPVRAYDHRQQVLLAIEAHNAVASRIIAVEGLGDRRVPGGTEADNGGTLHPPHPQ